MVKLHQRKYIYFKWGVILVIILASFFRFYNLHKWFIWGMDQEYGAYIVRNIISLKHFPLIGVNASNTGIYLGPFFLYFAAIPFWIFQGNPIGWGITASLIGVLVCFLIYRIGQEMFSKSVGFFASIFYSISFLASFYDRQFWNPTLVPLFSLLIGYYSYLILKKETKYLIWLIVVFSLSIQSHLSMLSFVPIIVYVCVLRRKSISRRTLSFSIGLFILLQSPLIFFELRHNFLNTQAFYSLVSGKNKITQSDSNFGQRYKMFLSTLGRFYWTPPAPDLFIENGQCKDYVSYRKNSYPESIALVLFALITFLWYWLKTKVKDSSFWSARVILGICFTTFFIIVFYRRILYEYYFLYFIPWLAVILGWVTDYFHKKRFGKVITGIVIFIFILVNLLTLSTTTMSYSYLDKLNMISFIKENLGENNYSLEALGDCSRFGGYRYLYSHFLKTPVHSYMDSYFSWLYPDEKDPGLPRDTVLLSLIDSRDNPINISKWQEIKLQIIGEMTIKAEKRIGDIQAYLLE